MSECIRGSYDDALYKSTYTVLYFTASGYNNATRQTDITDIQTYYLSRPIHKYSWRVLTIAESTIYFSATKPRGQIALPAASCV